MNTFQTSLGRPGNPYERDGTLNSNALAAQEGMHRATEFQLHMSEQATSLKKLQIYQKIASNMNQGQ